MSNNPNITDTEATITTDNGGASSVTVSITVNAKTLGADAFIKMEEVHAFASPASTADAIIKRDEMLDILREQIIEQAKAVAASIRDEVARMPKGVASVVPVQAASNPGTQAGTQAPAFGAPATVAVANGAAPAAQGGWASVPSRFGDGDLRFLTTAAFSSAQLEAEVNAWLQGHGLNPSAFKVWDNRPGPKGLEAGVPNGCVATIKVNRDAQSFVSPDIANQAIGRVKFNSNGTLYIWFTKEAEAAVKYGALDRVKLTAQQPTEEAF
jgi:hypothetical protein